MEFREVNNPIHETETILPTRATAGSAGYDLLIKEEVILEAGESVLTFTDVKCEFPKDYVMLLFIRSSLGKLGIQLANGVGVIDSDYYNNPDNDGNIGIVLYNASDKNIALGADQRVVQGVVVPYLANDDTTDTREGGFGSSGK